MEKSLLIGGFGGQGIQTLGKLIAYAANEEDCEVTFSPAYGGEMRGGTSNCTVVVGDTPITSPNKNKCDIVVVMNEDSLKAFESRVKSGGLIIINESLVKSEPSRDDIKVEKAQFNQVSNTIGNDKVLNVVTLGYIVESTGIISEEAAKKILEEKLGKKPQFKELNEYAFIEGAALAKGCM